MSRISLRTLVAFVALAAALGSTGCVVATLSSVGAGYTAKVACSLAWNSGENVDDLLRSYIRPEAAPLGGLPSGFASDRESDRKAAPVLALATLTPALAYPVML